MQNALNCIRPAWLRRRYITTFAAGGSGETIKRHNALNQTMLAMTPSEARSHCTNRKSIVLAMTPSEARSHCTNRKSIVLAMTPSEARSHRTNKKSIVLAMNLTVILLTAGFLNVCASGVSQNVSFSGRDVPLESVFSSVKKQTGCVFMYTEDVLLSSKPVSISVKDVPLETFLAEIFKSQPLEYSIKGKSIFITAKPAVDLFSDHQGYSPGTGELALAPIRGKVLDEDGQPLAGASVTNKKSKNSGVTNAQGVFTLNASAGDVILISFVGYETREVRITSENLTNSGLTLNVSLAPSETSLEEVVINKGYYSETQRLTTGSVSTVGAQELIKRPVPNVQNLLQGKVAGLQIVQASSMPGDEGNEISLRGKGTFSGVGSTPLVLIDGISGDMSNLDPNDVESISVLRDAASSAIYGARAANGVIVVTTKKGKATALTIEYHGNIQAQQATMLPKLVTNSAEYMELWNEAKIREGAVPYFTQTEIDNYRNSTDRVKYPNFNWIEDQFHSAVVQNHHLNINGGNENTHFNMSLGYLDQGGIVSIFDFKKYNARLSVDSKVNKWITIGGQVLMVKKDIVRSSFETAPVFTYPEASWTTYAQAPLYTPTMTLPDGTTGYVGRYSRSIAEWTVRNPEAEAASGSYSENRHSVASQFYVDIKLHDNLTWLTKGAVSYDEVFSKLHETPVDNYYFVDSTYAHNNYTWHLGVTDNFSTNLLTTLYSTLNFHKVFNKIHNVTVLAGYNQESNFFRQLGGVRINFPSNSLRELNAGAALDQSNSGTANEWAIQSYFGRLAYNFKSKYLFEANARYDGTSRIAPDTRWGLFPSVSAAWRVSEESFVRNNWLTNMKIRASWGQLGNQNIGLYPYQDLLAITSYPFNGLNPGAILTNLVDKTLKWETTTITDFGVDIDINNGLFTATVDWYNKITDGILYQVPIPMSVGLAAPTINFGKMKNTGWDFVLGHRHNIGQIKYGVTGVVSTFKNEVISIKTPSYGDYTIIKEGIPFGSFYLIEWEGIFQNQGEIDKSPKHPFDPKPGDLKFKDQNNDGIIDAEDRVVVPGAFPKFNYSGTIDLAWKNFNLSAFFLGVVGQKFYHTGLGVIVPYSQGSPPTLDFVKNRWTGEGSTNKYPAIFTSLSQPQIGTGSTFWLLNSSYLRLKNLNIGYQFPQNISRKIGMKDVRVYVSGDNLLTFTKYPETDPERVSGNGFGTAYPQVTIYTFGIRVRL